MVRTMVSGGRSVVGERDRLGDQGGLVRPFDFHRALVIKPHAAGDILDLEVALAPCTIGYGEIARLIEASPTRNRDANAYESWIAMYAGTEYQALAAGAADRLDALGESHGGAARLPALSADFAKAAQLEADFWQMGLRAA